MTLGTVWLYKGNWPLPRSAAAHASPATEHLYVLGFDNRTKIGITKHAQRRLRSLAWDHETITGKLPARIALTMPSPWAREIETAALTGFGPARLAGEYTTASFDQVCAVITALWVKHRQTADATALLALEPKRADEPRMYRVQKPRPMWMVSWTTSIGKMTNGRRKRAVKYFVQKEEADDYLKTVHDLWRGGLLHQQQDARTAAGILAGSGMTLTELAQRYIAGR